ncbi:PREDICTED: protein GAMETE EXPRESSED 1-like [Ipomoea nil]|uniref:protein GAMETE EXPRESSED 1-like n=1 Tax=Ipomoea nil TaxID=35883 RepID=UPI000901B4FF|nr:PREDICTED: protein GAMETE EXPRESSED 1-like [Ipomoea nil]
MGHLLPKQVGVLLCLMILSSQTCFSWGWWFFSSGREQTQYRSSSENHYSSSKKLQASEFSMKPFESARGLKLVEAAQEKMLAPNSCWRRAYQSVFAECSKVLPDEELKSRLAWHLTDCFQQHSGRPSLPLCDSGSAMSKCLKNLDDSAHRTYLEFFLQTDSICHQLQMHAFRHDTERLVNELKNNAENVWEKLEDIGEKEEIILQTSAKIDDSLASVDHRTQDLERASKNVEARVNEVLRHSESIHEQSLGISESQKELSEGQAKMKEKLAEGIEMVHQSYTSLDKEMNELKNEAEEIEKEIGKVGEEMFSKMRTLQVKADDIENIAGVSLDKQKELLNGQSAALDGIQILNKFLSQALEESRGTLQQLAEIGHKQQDELLRRQEQLQQAHDHLVENSKTILAAQEAFESKQASMFVALDKLFALHNAMLLESRLIKAFLVYSMSIFLLYMFTSMKQTYNVRPRLYIGLCATFAIELAIVRYGTYEIEKQSWVIGIIRSLFMFAASIQLLYAIWTYRDYEILNHQMLVTLIEKVNGIQKHKELSWEMESDSESEVNWSSWVDTELPDDVDKLEDPDYILLEEVAENHPGMNNALTCRRYNLRNRHNRLM